MNVGTQKVNGAAMPPPLFAQQPKRDTKPHRVTMLITPQYAEQILKGNTHNRRLRTMTVGTYAKDMSSGRWSNNFSPIILSPEMVLIDGQHRLHACVKSGIAFEADVIFNAPMEIQRVIDNPATRTAADSAGLEGVANSARASAVARLLLLHKQHGISRMNNTSLYPSKLEIIQETLANPNLQGALIFGKKPCAPSVIDFCHYLFREQNSELARKFMDEVTTGAGITKENPTYVLRERLNDNNNSKAKLPTLDIIALFFKAWKAYRDKKKLKLLRWTAGAEQFPEI